MQGRDELKLHLERLSTHPPKRIIDIPVPFAERYFAMMPFDKQFLTPDAPTARGFLQLQLVTVSRAIGRAHGRGRHGDDNFAPADFEA